MAEGSTLCLQAEGSMLCLHGSGKDAVLADRRRTPRLLGPAQPDQPVPSFINRSPCPSPLTAPPLPPADLLAARPRRRAGITLWQGLRHLASLKELLVENQGGGGMPGNALACSSLRGLTLLCAAAEDWPESLLHRYSEL